MTPSKKKSLTPKEVSVDPPIKAETPIIELPNDENKLFDKEDDGGTSTIPDLYYPVRMRKKKSSPTIYGNMPLMSYSNCPHSMPKETALKNGSSIKIWIIWNNFINGMKMT